MIAAFLDMLIGLDFGFFLAWHFIFI